MLRRRVELWECQTWTRRARYDAIPAAFLVRDIGHRGYRQAFLGTRQFVTTQTSFDLSGLIQSIESNSGYQVALYAEHAEVQIIDRDHPEQAARTVRGRPAIRRWIEAMVAPDIVHHIVDAKAD